MKTKDLIDGGLYITNNELVVRVEAAPVEMPSVMVRDRPQMRGAEVTYISGGMIGRREVIPAARIVEPATPESIQAAEKRDRNRASVDRLVDVLGGLGVAASPDRWRGQVVVEDPEAMLAFLAATESAMDKVLGIRKDVPASLELRHRLDREARDADAFRAGLAGVHGDGYAWPNSEMKHG